MAVEGGRLVVFGIDHDRMDSHALREFQREVQREGQQFVADALPLEALVDGQPADAQDRHRVARQFRYGGKFRRRHLSDADGNEAGDGVVRASQGDIGFTDTLALLLSGTACKELIERTAIQRRAIRSRSALVGFAGFSQAAINSSKACCDSINVSFSATTRRAAS